MALVVMCGLPCSGKSAAAAALAERIGARDAPLKAVVVDEPSLHLSRGAYASMRTEKESRATLRSAVDRAASKSSVVIVDAMNAIKGYRCGGRPRRPGERSATGALTSSSGLSARPLTPPLPFLPRVGAHARGRYELWCIARSAGLRYCVVHCDCSAAAAAACNAASGEDGPAGARASRWPAEVMTDLCARFERPDARNRWDKPLFTLHTGAELPGGGGTGAAGGGVTVESVLPSIATPSGTIVHGATEKRPREEVLAAAVAHVLGEAAPGGGGGSAAGASHGGLTQGLATITQRPSSNANALAELDAAANRVIEAIMAAQAASGTGAAGKLQFGADAVQLSQPLPLPALRRFKRSFAKLINGTLGGRGQVPTGAAAEGMFASFVAKNASVQGATR